MDNLWRFETINEYNVFNNNETLRTLGSVVNFSKAAPRQGSRMYFGFYTVFLKDVKCGDLLYGKHTYDYQEGSLVFMAPGQAAGGEQLRRNLPTKSAWVGFLYRYNTWHRPWAAHTGLQLFGYQSNEAFHLSERERKTVLDCFSKIEYELQHPIDKHSKRVIVSNIELFLNYCLRFFDRQFITRDKVHKSILERFETFLRDHFQTEKTHAVGLPSLAYCAGKLNLSASYFGDLVKKKPVKPRRITYN